LKTAAAAGDGQKAIEAAAFPEETPSQSGRVKTIL
jgi:hypothetical protein